MGKEPKRKCSHCGHNGHNSRTCNGKGGNCSSFRLFGVKINVPDYDFSNGDIESIRKTKSMGNLQACKPENNAVDATGYLSDGLFQSSTTKADRRKGKPWTEHEHRCFLSGLEKLGKGDWRGISKTFVPTRTPTQVASHAQKYFLRLAASEKRKRRSSVFDIGLNGSSASSTSPTKEAPESSSQQANTSTIPPLKLKAHANTSIFLGSSERPPLSPIARPQGGIDFHRLPYMMGVSSNDHHHGHSTGAVSFVHVMNFPNGDFMYLPQFNGKIGTCSSSPKLMTQQGSSSMFPQTIPHRVPPQGGAAPARTTKDGVELGLGTLTL